MSALVGQWLTVFVCSVSLLPALRRHLGAAQHRPKWAQPRHSSRLQTLLGPLLRANDWCAGQSAISLRMRQWQLREKWASRAFVLTTAWRGLPFQRAVRGMTRIWLAASASEMAFWEYP